MSDVATLIRSGKVDQAEHVLEQTKNTNSADWQYRRGLLLEVKGHIDEAVEAYEKAIAMDNNCLDAVFRLACTLDLYVEEERAMVLYESLVGHVPAHVNAILNLAMMYEDHEEFEDAHCCIERVLIDHPNHPRARLFLKDIESSMSMHYDESQERSREKRNAIRDTPVSDFELSVRSRNCLKKMNINTLGDLLRISEAELLSYKNFGETSLNEIKAMLKQKTLRIGQLKEEAQQTTRPTTAAPRRQSD